MIYFKQKEYYVYKEYDDEFGLKEQIYISSVFENINELFEYMNERKQFWHGNTRKIEIELIHGLQNGSDDNVQ